ncbi:unnamed protein product, partial [Penicillium nalgiovense]
LLSGSGFGGWWGGGGGVGGWAVWAGWLDSIGFFFFFFRRFLFFFFFFFFFCFCFCVSFRSLYLLSILPYILSGLWRLLAVHCFFIPIDIFEGCSVAILLFRGAPCLCTYISAS